MSEATKILLGVVAATAVLAGLLVANIALAA